MTAVVASKDAAGIHMGADSLCVDEYTSCERLEPKLFRLADVLCGCAGDVRSCDIVQGFTLPDRRESETHHHDFLSGRFVSALQKSLEKGGCLRESGGVYRWDCELLLAVRGSLFYIGPRFSVGECANYAAIGSGKEVCLGSLHSTEQYTIPTRERLTMALEAAADQTPYVSSPFVFESVDNE